MDMLKWAKEATMWVEEGARRSCGGSNNEKLSAPKNISITQQRRTFLANVKKESKDIGYDTAS